MPEIVSSYTKVKTGHKVKVKSDIKPFIKNAKVADWYYAIQYIGEDGKKACMLMTKAAFDTGKLLCAKSNIEDPSLGKLVKHGFKYTINLYDEDEDYVCEYEFYANVIKCAIDRALKHPNLCTSIEVPKKRGGFFSKLFSK